MSDVAEPIHFLWVECPDCEYSLILPWFHVEGPICPVCAADNGHDVPMLVLPTARDDVPEGFDARTVRR